VLEVLGAVDTEVFSKLLRKVLAEDVAGAISQLEELVIEGRDLGQFVNDFTWYLRNLLLLKGSDDMEEVLDMSSENMALLKEEARLVEADVLMRYIRIFSELSNQVKYSSQKRILIEIAIIKLCKPAMETNMDSITDRLAKLEKKMEQGIPTAAPVNTATQPAEAAAPQIHIGFFKRTIRLILLNLNLHFFFYIIRNHLSDFISVVMGNLMKQAQKMQRQMEEASKELEEKEVTAAAGGGAVEVTVSGKKEVTKVKIDPEAVDPDDVEMLEDMIMAATNEALRQIEEYSQQSMSKITGGMGGLGGGFPF